MGKFREFLAKLSSTITDYDTNNGWGFGGAYGKQYNLSCGIKVLIADACYRHTGSTPFVRVENEKEVFFNCGRGKKNIKEITDFINNYNGDSNKQLRKDLR